MKAILLIGGMGTRLRPLTLDTPKPLLPLLGKPFLQYQIQWLRSYGIRDIILCTSYRPEAFKNVLGSGKKLGVSIRYIHEKSPLGTGGAIKNAESQIQGPTLICNGDILMDLDIADFLKRHQKRRSDVSIALQRVDDPSAYGLIEVDSSFRINAFKEKPKPHEITTNTVNMGVYLFEPHVFHEIPKNKVVSIERDTFPSLLRSQFRLYGFPMKSYWMDIGTPAKFMRAQFDLMSNQVSFFSWKKRSKVWIDPSARVHPQAKIAEPSVVGKGCRLSSGVHMASSILLNHVFLDEGVEIQDSIVANDVVIGKNVRIRNAGVIGQNSRISDYSQL